MTVIRSDEPIQKRIEDGLAADGYVPLPDRAFDLVAAVNGLLVGTGKRMELTFGPWGRPWVKLVDKPA